MSVRDFDVEHCKLSDIKDFVETHHYSHNVNGLRLGHCFKLLRNGNLIGGMIYGKLAMANAWRKYGENEDDVIELRRLVCVDDTPKNTESYFIGHTLRWLRKNTDIKTIISYADAHFGHEGTIYKATNFEHIGMTSKTRVIIVGDKTYHDKTIRTYYTTKDGVRKLKPYARKIKEMLESGDAYYDERPPKHIYRFNLK